MSLELNQIEKLRQFVESNEVVYQEFENVIEISNDQNPQNRKALLDCFKHVSSVEVYQKGSAFIHEPFEELDKWATDEDLLFLLELIGVLICIPRKVAIEQKLISKD